MNPRPIVVGVAGAGSGDLAVDWAAAEAHRRRLPLRIVHVLEWCCPRAGGSPEVIMGGDALAVG